MKNRLTALSVALGAALLTLPGLVAAGEPNIRPGLWESESAFSYEGNMPFPARTVTSEECVTHEDIKQGFTFFDDEEMDGCEITHADVRSDGMEYTLACMADEVQLTMEGSMKFQGDTASGEVAGAMNTPMGPVTMRIKMASRRIGDC
jgi:hypothetical protein